MFLTTLAPWTERLLRLQSKKKKKRKENSFYNVYVIYRAGVTGLLIELSAGKELPKPEYHLASKYAPFLVFYVRHESAFGLIHAQNVSVEMKLNLKNVTRVASNVLVETKKGDPSAVVMLGAHLDSYFTSPGINDNGSAVALLLEMAKMCAEKDVFKKMKNKVRFAFWGLQKYGLLGSKFYLDVNLLVMCTNFYFLHLCNCINRASTELPRRRLPRTSMGT